MCRQLSDLGKKIDCVLESVFTSRKTSKILKVTETKPSQVNQQCLMDEFKCNLCDVNYKGYMNHHLHLHIEEHKYSIIHKHLENKHNWRPNNLHEKFFILKKWGRKFECLICEMLLIRKRDRLWTLKKTPFQWNRSFNYVYSFVLLHLIWF